MAEQENFDIPMIVTVGIVSTVLIVACVVGVQALYLSHAQADMKRKVVFAPTADADSKLAEQDAKLARYGWANREQGQVVVPIERAMELVVTDYAKRDGGSRPLSVFSAFDDGTSAIVEVRRVGEVAR